MHDSALVIVSMAMYCLHQPLQLSIMNHIYAVLPGGVVYTEYDPSTVNGLCVSIISLNQVATFAETKVGVGGKEAEEEVCKKR